jgi:hypothetical protein
MGLMDLLYTLGPSGLVNTFKKFSSAYNGRDWKTASIQSRRPGVQDTRNEIVSAWFRELTSGHRLYIFGFATPGTGIHIDNLDESTPTFTPRFSR